MKTYKAKPLALPFIDEVQGYLYTNAVEQENGELVSTGEYYLRNYYSTYDTSDFSVILNHVDYKIDEKTLEEVTFSVDLADNNDITWVAGEYYVGK